MFWKNKRIWIVGASSGIGAGLVIALAKEGARLVISARREELLKELAETSHATAIISILPLDVEDLERSAIAAGQAWEIYDGLDYIFLNAGIAMRDRAVNSDMEVAQKVMRVNFWAPVAITKALLPRLTAAKEAHLVVTSSLSGKFGVPQMSIYAASKHALHGYFESLRTEVFQTGLKIHLAIPGFINTDITLSGLKGDGTLYGKSQPSLAQGMDPLVCSEKILQSLEKNREEFVIGGMEKYVIYFYRIFPGLAKKLMRANPVKKVRELKERFGKGK